ncbi:MAG: septal ring lytic transglycosylase RlpA family protein [Candidatus Competibacteraceae bacterium]
MAKFWSHALPWMALAGVLAGCGTVSEPSRPTGPPSLMPPASTDRVKDEPVPRAEPPSRGGNPDTYVVFGRRYRVSETSAGYREQGIASWYGQAFHGRKTSSGQPFDMFELTAAHKSLPLPTHVRVTHLENGRSIVVRITDRGPFAGDRIIDLSYAAAQRLGMVEQGTARVEVAALEPYQFLPKLAARRAEQQERLAARQLKPSGARLAAPTAKGKATRSGQLVKAPAAGRSGALYMVGTVSNPRDPQQLRNRLASQLRRDVRVESGAGRQNPTQVRVPLRHPGEAREMAVRLASLGVSQSRVVTY